MNIRSTKIVNSTMKQYLYIGDYTQDFIGSRLQLLEKLHKWDLRNNTIYISYSHIIEREFIQIYL